MRGEAHALREVAREGWDEEAGGGGNAQKLDVLAANARPGRAPTRQSLPASIDSLLQQAGTEYRTFRQSTFEAKHMHRILHRLKSSAFAENSALFICN